MSTVSRDLLVIEVVYVSPERTFRCPLRLEPGATVREAIDASGLLAACPEVDLRVQRVGIFARLVELDRKLADGDRVEVYRPLVADAKERRRRRAQGRARTGAG